MPQKGQISVVVRRLGCERRSIYHASSRLWIDTLQPFQGNSLEGRLAFWKILRFLFTGMNNREPDSMDSDLPKKT